MDLEINPASQYSASSAPSASFVWMWGVPLFALSALALLLATGGNIALFVWLNRLTAQAGDTLWSYLTALGDTSLALMFILPLLGRRSKLVWQFVLAALFATICSHGMKALFSTLRPPAVLHEGSFHLIGPMLEHNSFPSGHTTTIFVLAGLCCLQRLDNRLKFMVLILAIFVGLSRIACGVHWPVDVLGGMLGGWLSALAGIWLSQRWKAGINIRFQRVFSVLLSVSALWAIFFYNNGLPGTRPFQVTITVACLVLSIKGQYRLFTINRLTT